MQVSANAAHCSFFLEVHGLPCLSINQARCPNTEEALFPWPQVIDRHFRETLAAAVPTFYPTMLVKRHACILS
jgi:hypothetical protein